MPRGSQDGTTTETGVAGGRFTVQLPAELKPMIDELGAATTAAVVAVGGLPIELSGAAVVAACIKARHAQLMDAVARAGEGE